MLKTMLITNRCITLVLLILFIGKVDAQLSLQDGITSYLIDFDSTVSGVSTGVFTGTGFSLNPVNGELDAAAWSTSGMSDGDKEFDIVNTTGDHARGTSTGGVTSGGFYGFDIGMGNIAIGIQPTGNDWTSGTLTLKMDNNSTSVINEMNIDYTIYVRNDQDRASSFNFSFSSNNSSFTNVSSGDYTSPEIAGTTDWISNNRSIILTGLQIDPGSSFYIRWTGNDVSGSGSRDEIALDDIDITATSSTVACSEPTAQASSLNFETITSNSIQASFTGGTADKYLVVQSTNNTLGEAPLDGEIYAEGTSIGTGEVVQYNETTSINSIGLSENTTYYYFIFASNDNCISGPDYLSINPLTGSALTMMTAGSTYYNVIGNETCENLKTALFNLIDDHTSVSYNSLWTHFQTTDDHLNDAGTEVIVWDMYSDNQSGAENEFTFVVEQCGTFQQEGDCYNREHSFPKSWWGGSTNSPQYTDLFTVLPVDGWINGVRNSNPYGEVQSGTEIHIMNNGSSLGSSSIIIPGYTGSVFEPTDDYKGDLARGYFYMATRYENEIASWELNSTESDAVLNGTSYTVFEPWMLNLLISWHQLDPVDVKEINRNEAIFAIQGNRNPFIDDPEYVASIWSSCDSACANELLTITTSDITGNDMLFNEAEQIESSAQIGFNNIHFTASTSIEMGVNFEVVVGNTFTVEIWPCP